MEKCDLGEREEEKKKCEELKYIALNVIVVRCILYTYRYIKGRMRFSLSNDRYCLDEHFITFYKVFVSKR